MSDEGAFAPVLLKYEMMNSLLAAERRGRITSIYRQRALSQFQRMSIQFDISADPEIWHRTADLAATHRLTGYDAVYLAMAIRSRLPLATFDKEIIAAARSLSVPLF